MLEMTQKFFNEESMLPLIFTTQYLYENNQEAINYGRPLKFSRLVTVFQEVPTSFKTLVFFVNNSVSVLGKDWKP